MIYEVSYKFDQVCHFSLKIGLLVLVHDLVELYTTYFDVDEPP